MKSAGGNDDRKKRSDRESLSDMIEDLARQIAHVIGLGMLSDQETRAVLAYLADMRTFYRGAILAAGSEAAESLDNARAELLSMIRILKKDIDFAVHRISSNA